MQFRLSAEDINKSFKFSLLAEEDFAEDEPVKDQSGDTKAFDGRPAYRTNLIVSDITGDRVRILPGSTVKVRTKPTGKVAESLDVKLAGTVVVTPWVNYRANNQLCYSIIADGIAQVPQTTTTKGRGE